MNKNTFASCYSYYVSSLAHQWLTWTLAALMAVLTGVLYLVSGYSQTTYFSGTAPFFSTIALVSLLLLPVLSIRAETPQVQFEETFPVSPLIRTLSEICAIETVYLFSLLLTVPILFAVGKLIVIEAAPCCTSYLALILYSFCIISFCVWISRFFMNTVFSYLVTAFLLFVCNTIHLLPLDVAWIKTISFIWHFDSASKGIIATKDLVFFACVAVFCISAAVESNRFRKNPENTRPLLHMALEFLLCVLIAGNGQVYAYRIDTTADKRFSLSSQSLAIIQQVQEPLHITWYVSKTILNRYPQADDMRHLLNQYADSSPLISLSVISDSDKIAEAQLGQLGITPQAISDTNTEETRTMQVYSAMVLEMGSSTGVIPFVLSNTSLEYDISFRIRSMVSGQVPVVAILNGTGLSLDSSYTYVKPWISSGGMIPVEITADQLAFLRDTDRSVLLVIGSESFSSEDVRAIDQWVLAGKPAFFSVNPVSVDIQATWQADFRGQNPLLQLLDFYGVRMDNTLLSDTDCYTLTMYSSASQSAPEYVAYPYWFTVDTPFGSNVQLFWPTPLSIYETEVCRISPIASAGGSAQSVSAPYITNPFALQNGLEYAGAFIGGNAVRTPIAALLEGKVFSFYEGTYSQENRVLVMGDQYFLSNMVENTGSGQNFSYLISSLLYLTGDEDLIAIKSRWE